MVEGGYGLPSLFSMSGDNSLGKLNIDISDVKKLLGIVERHHLEELTVEEGDLSVTVKGHSIRPQAQMIVQTGLEPVAIEESDVECDVEENTEAEEKIDGNIVDIKASLVGVFYRSSSPETPPCVEVGDVIEVGAEVGLIEAMKVFSPIPSEVAGEVVEIPAENGKLVHEGDVLVRIRIPEE